MEKTITKDLIEKRFLNDTKKKYIKYSTFNLNIDNILKRIFRPRFVIGYLLGFTTSYIINYVKIQRFINKRNIYIEEEISKLNTHIKELNK